MKTIHATLAAAMLIGLSGCALGVETTTFALENAGEEELYSDQRGWLTIEADGLQVALSEPTCMTPCGRPVGNVVCALGAELASVVPLAAGESRTMDWDGVYYEIDSERGCYKKRKRGAEFVAEFCYSHEYEQYGEGWDGLDEDRIWDANIIDPVCERVPFERGGEVEIVAE